MDGRNGGVAAGPDRVGEVAQVSEGITHAGGELRLAVQLAQRVRSLRSDHDARIGAVHPYHPGTLRAVGKRGDRRAGISRAGRREMVAHPRCITTRAVDRNEISVGNRPSYWSLNQ